MSDPTWTIVRATSYVLPALIWTILAQDLWHFRFTRSARSALYRLLPPLTTCIALSYFLFALVALAPLALRARPPGWLLAIFIASDVSIIFAVAMFRHASALFPLREQRTSNSWRATNYGLATVMAFFSAAPSVLPGATLEEDLEWLRILFFSYVVAMLVLSSLRISRYARRGVWRPGSLGEARNVDIGVLAAGVLGIGAAFASRMGGNDFDQWPVWIDVLNGAIGLVLAAPFVARSLGLVARGVLIVAGSTALALAAWAAVRALAAAIGDASNAAALDLASVLAPLAVVVPLQGMLRAAIDRLLFRRTERRRADLHAFLLRLSPELGTAEYARRALAEAVRVMNLRGAALLLDRDRSVTSAGEIDIEPLRHVWPTGADADSLPVQTFGAATFRGLPHDLQEALVDAETVAVVPMISPRRRWGFAFATGGSLSATFTEEDLRAVQAFADQVALGLDAAELLERAVAVERSLAHSEKLAAIGELAARVAHEIRNPVTAARSLAQQLAREPTSPFREEHELIIKELERIERQVAALLRFARREELHLESVDLGRLASTTVGELGPRLHAAGIDVRLDVQGGAVASADREKLRQVAINLIENAVDALAGKDGQRCLRIASSTDNGRIGLEIADNGPGVPEGALERLFEPFFSLKASGTGLGLAIAKRTVEAHGGTITAGLADGGGMCFTIELPAARGSDGGGNDR